MLIEFTIGNFRSYRDLATLSMVATKLTAKDKSLDEYNVFSLPDQPRLLTTAALYGPNASGKSNLIDALKFMQSFVLYSVAGTEAKGKINVSPFRLNPRTAEKPSHFEAAFITDGQRYRYGFEVTDERVINEWLFTVPKQKQRQNEVRLFERTPDDIQLGPSFREGRRLAERTRPNALFLSVVAQFNGTTAQKVIDWFRRLGVTSGLNDMQMKIYTEQKLVRGESVEAIVALITRLDLGILNVTAEKETIDNLSLPSNMPDELQRAVQTIMEHNKEIGFAVHVKTAHRTYDDDGSDAGPVEFDMDADESSGTRKLFAMAAPLLETLAEGQVMVVDELDSRLHTTMTRAIIELFNHAETNPRHAQLIFTAQDTNLLDHDLLRRDQIWFVEKDSKGASQLYSLAEFKGIRNDLYLERSYVQGRFGAVPFIDNLRSTITESQAAYGA